MPFNMDKLKQQLVRHEDLKTKMYQDTMGFWTIGVGHNLSAKPISERAALVILEDDIDDTLRYCLANFPWFTQLDDVRQRVVMDMTFNLGAKIKGFHNTLKAIEERRWSDAAHNMLDSLWARQVGQRAERLAKMMESGKD